MTSSSILPTKTPRRSPEMELESPTHAVDDLLAELAAAVDDSDTERLDELGDRADEIVSTTDLSELVAALGLGGDEQPESLLAAVAAGGPREVAALRSLLTASKLPAAGEDQKAQLVDELKSLVETAQTEPADEEESTETDRETDAEPTDTESDSESESTEKEHEPEAEAEAESTEPDEPESEDTGSVRHLLESQLQDTLDIFDDGLNVEGLTDGLSDELTGGLTDNETETDDSEPSEETDERDQSTQSRDGTRWRPGARGRTTHSTIPTSGRRDIGRSGRYSSVRGSTVSNR